MLINQQEKLEECQVKNKKVKFKTIKQVKNKKVKFKTIKQIKNRKVKFTTMSSQE